MKRALGYGRSRQSPLTRFLHLSPFRSQSWETIPIFENLCFVVALLRSHVIANILEGRDLLKKILAFQILFGKEEGLFPRYLHEYPHVDGKEHLIFIALALYLLQSQHKQLLQLELQETVNRAIDRLLQAMQKKTWIETLSLFLCVLQGGSFEEKSLLNLRPTSVRECVYLLHLTQILFLRKHRAASESFHHLTSHWSREFNTYIGPLENERYHSSEEPLSLFHFFMRQITNSELNASPGRVHLHASLLYLKESLPDLRQTLPILHAHWKIERSTHLLWQICTTLPAQACPGFHLFRILWKDGTVYTALCQQLLRMRYRKINPVECVLIFEETPPHGIEIYFRKTKESKIYSGKKRATCFNAGEWITIDTGNKNLYLQFVSPTSSSSIATLSMQHRPAELQSDSAHVDWKLSIRVLAIDSKNHWLQLRVREGNDCPLPSPSCADRCQHTESLP